MIEIDDKQWPLVVLRYIGPHSDEQMASLSDRMTDFLRRQEPYVAIADAQKSDGMSPAQRQQQADWMKRHDAELRRYCLGSAFIITSAMARLTMHVITVLRPLPVPYTFVSTMEAAAVWASDRFKAAGMSLPAMRTLHTYGPRPGRERA